MSTAIVESHSFPDGLLRRATEVIIFASPVIATSIAIYYARRPHSETLADPARSNNITYNQGDLVEGDAGLVMDQEQEPVFSPKEAVLAPTS